MEVAQPSPRNMMAMNGITNTRLQQNPSLDRQPSSPKHTRDPSSPRHNRDHDVRDHPQSSKDATDTNTGGQPPSPRSRDNDVHHARPGVVASAKRLSVLTQQGSIPGLRRPESGESQPASGVIKRVSSGDEKSIVIPPPQVKRQESIPPPPPLSPRQASIPPPPTTRPASQEAPPSPMTEKPITPSQIPRAQSSDQKPEIQQQQQPDNIDEDSTPGFVDSPRNELPRPPSMDFPQTSKSNSSSNLSLSSSSAPQTPHTPNPRMVLPVPFQRPPSPDTALIQNVPDSNEN